MVLLHGDRRTCRWKPFVGSDDATFVDGGGTAAANSWANDLHAGPVENLFESFRHTAARNHEVTHTVK
jgi:hypothetical protein